MIWRCRLDSDTMSSSTTPSAPTPAAARYISAGPPKPPAPITSTEDSFNAAWPGPPTSRSTIWRRERSGPPPPPHGLPHPLFEPTEPTPRPPFLRRPFIVSRAPCHVAARRPHPCSPHPALLPSYYR